MEHRFVGRPLWAESPPVESNPLCSLVAAMVTQARRDIAKARRLGDKADAEMQRQAATAAQFIAEVRQWVI